MGNQASKVIERTKEKKRLNKTTRRRSTITIGSKSHASLATKANYDWIDDKQELNMIHPPLPINKSRRQSITEFFSGRKKSIAQDDLREFDRLQRQVKLDIWKC